MRLQLEKEGKATRPWDQSAKEQLDRCHDDVETEAASDDGAQIQTAYDEDVEEAPADANLMWAGCISNALLEKSKLGQRTGKAVRYRKRTVSYLLLMSIYFTN